MPSHAMRMELALRNEDLPVDWESKMSQMLCFPSFSGVVGQPIAGHTRSGTANPCASQGIEGGWQIIRRKFLV